MKTLIRFASVLAVIAAIGAPYFASAHEPTDEEVIHTSKYMIGIAGNTEVDGRVIVEQVAPKSPAAKAGVQVGDVVLRLGKFDVSSIVELSQAVEAVKANATDIRISRDGKKLTLKITPTKRQLVEELFVNPAPAKPERFSVFFPGVLLNGFRNLPKGVEVKVVGQGDDPAKLIISKGKQKWESAANKLHELPEEAQAALGIDQIVRQLSRIPGEARKTIIWHPSTPPAIAPVQPKIEWTQPVPRVRVEAVPRLVAPASPAQQKRIEQIEAELKRLREAVDKLQKQHE